MYVIQVFWSTGEIEFYGYNSIKDILTAKANFESKGAYCVTYTETEFRL